MAGSGCTTSASAPRTPAKRVLALADDNHITLIELETGEVLSSHLIEPDRAYWRNQNKQPGRWPSSPK